MHRIVFEYKTKPERFFELASEDELPDWFALRVIREVYAALPAADRGTLPFRVGSVQVPLQYYTKGSLVHVFVPMTKELNWSEAVASFADYVREHNLIPHSISAAKVIETKDPESVFKILSQAVETLASRLSGLYGFEVEVEPEISYTGNDFKIEFTLPLDKTGMKEVQKWAKSHSFTVEMNEAPIEEKMRA